MKWFDYITYGQMFALMNKELPSAFEARQLFCFVTGLEAGDVPGCRDVVAPREQWSCGAALMQRRLNGEPLQYLLGEWEFYGIPLYVGEGVLIPRADTELLVDIVLSGEHLDSSEPKVSVKPGDITQPVRLEILDLCSGSGCIAIALAKNLLNAALTAVELSQAAFRYLVKNIERNGADVQAVQADITTYTHSKKADIITANPPYIPERDIDGLQTEVGHEPRTALCGGKDGLDFYRIIAERYHSQLKPGGRLFLEVGAGQSEAVMEILNQAGFIGIKSYPDLCGIQRVVAGVAKTQTFVLY